MSPAAPTLARARRDRLTCSTTPSDFGAGWARSPTARSSCRPARRRRRGGPRSCPWRHRPWRRRRASRPRGREHGDEFGSAARARMRSKTTMPASDGGGGADERGGDPPAADRAAEHDDVAAYRALAPATPAAEASRRATMRWKRPAGGCAGGSASASGCRRVSQAATARAERRVGGKARLGRAALVAGRACRARTRPPGPRARLVQSRPPRHSFKVIRLRLRIVFTVATGRVEPLAQLLAAPAVAIGKQHHAAPIGLELLQAGGELAARRQAVAAGRRDRRDARSARIDLAPRPRRCARCPRRAMSMAAWRAMVVIQAIGEADRSHRNRRRGARS